MIIWSDEAIIYLQYSKQWKIWYLWNFEICYVSNRLKDLLYQRKSIWLSHTSDFFSCSDSTFFHFSIHSLCREMRHLSVDQGGMSFKAGPVIKKDLYPTRYSQPTPLTGTYCTVRYCTVLYCFSVLDFHANHTQILEYYDRLVWWILSKIVAFLTVQ